MRVLVISRDASLLDANSFASTRWRLLVKNGIELTAVVATPQAGERAEPGIKIIASGGSKITKYVQTYRIAKQEAKRGLIITAQDPFELGLIAMQAARHTGFPFEVQDHGGFFDGQPAQEPLWFLRRQIAAFVARRANRIRTVSPGSFDRFDRMALQPKAYLLPLAADARFAQLKRVPEPGLIVCVSRLIAVKRIGLLLDAFARLRRTNAVARLVVVGDGPERQALEAQASVLGMTETVQFVGHTDPAPWLGRASLFVLPSAHEGWGVAAVEAAMARVPVLMTETGCAGWLKNIGAAQILPVSASADEWAEEASRLLSGSPLGPGVDDPPTAESVAQKQAEQWKILARQQS